MRLQKCAAAKGLEAPKKPTNKISPLVGGFKWLRRSVLPKREIAFQLTRLPLDIPNVDISKVGRYLLVGWLVGWLVGNWRKNGMSLVAGLENAAFAFACGCGSTGYIPTNGDFLLIGRISG